MEAKLDPPIGTCYFKSYKCTLSDAERNAHMEVTFYIYVTLAKPTDPKFAENGGKVYIVAVYNGSAPSGFDLDFGVEDETGTLSAINQLPDPGTDERKEDTRVYTIDFAQNMSMFNNGGNGGYTFLAQYKRDFSLTGYSQSKYNSNNWSLKYDVSAKSHDQYLVLNGLQVFETNRLTDAKIKVFFTFGIPPVNFPGVIGPFPGAPRHSSKEFNIDFSAEIMAHAVVG